MKGQILAILLLAALCGSQVGAIEWRDGNDGRVRWGEYCDFNGNDIASVPSSGDSCGRHCLNNPSCTHFMWSSLLQTCYMKKSTVDYWIAQENLPEYSVCGWVVSTVPSFWKDGNGGKVKWGEYCDFFGNNIDTVSAPSGDDCGRLCLSNPSCSHFSWSPIRNTCHIKKAVAGVEWIALEKLPCHSVCGWVVATKWKDSNGNGGTFKWGENCDFNGNDIASVPSNRGEDCGGHCLNNPSCTHFMWNSKRNICYVKRATVSHWVPWEDLEDYSVCGWVVQRG